MNLFLNGACFPKAFNDVQAGVGKSPSRLVRDYCAYVEVPEVLELQLSGSLPFAHQRYQNEGLISYCTTPFLTPTRPLTSFVGMEDACVLSQSTDRS